MARQKANESVQHILALMQKGPRTMIGTIADTTFHPSMGYVTCQTQIGVVQVYGVPQGSMIAGMRIYCRQMGGVGTTRNFVYDGPALTLSSMGNTGSLLLSSLPVKPPTQSLAMISGVPSQAGTATAAGFYWHCAFYIPVLPSVPITLFSMAPDANTSSTILLELLPSGNLQFRSADGHGYIMNDPVVPQQMHWIVIQPGIATQECVVDGDTNYSGLLHTGDIPTFIGNSTTYTLSLLSNSTGTHLCPTGTWVSKVGYGATGGSFISTNFPGSDTDLYNSATTYALFLFEETAGAALAINSAVGSGSATTLPITTPASIQVAGPY